MEVLLLPAPLISRAVGHVSLPYAGSQRSVLVIAALVVAFSLAILVRRFILSALLVAVLPREIPLQRQIFILIDGAHLLRSSFQII
jgi:hypothetical protein